jgi:hypothetical protein
MISRTKETPYKTENYFNHTPPTTILSYIIRIFSTSPLKSAVSVIIVSKVSQVTEGTFRDTDKVDPLQAMRQ